MSKFRQILGLFSPSYRKALRDEVPVLDENEYWGPEDKKSETQDTSIRQFKIEFSDQGLEDLQNRLKNTRTFTPPLEGIHQQYGLNTKTLSEIIEYWKNDYNWREREKFLNQYPQFKTYIQGLDIHFLHIKPSVPSNVRVLPLLILHGWPGSVREFYRIIPFLTKEQHNRDFVFEVIAPSLPGYVFSQAAARPGMGAVQVAVVFKNLMKRLGHDKFYIQGGDWGGAIVTHMATLFPDNILGMHSNFCMSTAFISNMKVFFGSFYPSWVVEKKFQHKIYPIGKRFASMLEETGYMHIQATKPDTVGVALNDSPAGLASYILEKFSTGTNPQYRYVEGAGLLEKFDYDELLDNVMLYWITNSFTTAMRLYAESFCKAQFALNLQNIPIDEKVPCAAARFPNEILYQPDWILKDKYTNLVHSTDFDKGGHFAAMEEPELMAEDIFAAVQKMEKLHM